MDSNMWATSTRQDKRKACVAGILALAGVLLFHYIISLNAEIISPEPSGNDHSFSGGAAVEACQWSAGMPELYVLKHSRGHPKAGHWFHIAENFTGRRADLKDTISGMSGSTVFLQVMDPAWMAGLSPMSRLLILAGLTSVGTSEVHFVDADRSTFSYATTTSSSSSTSGSMEATTEGAAGGGGGKGNDGSRRTQPPQQQQQRQESVTLKGVRRPSPGQLGLLEFDPRGLGNEFVVSADTPLPQRLTVTAEDDPTTRGTRSFGAGSSGSGSSSSSSSSSSVVEPEGVASLRLSFGGENEGSAGGGEGGPPARVGVVVGGGSGDGAGSEGASYGSSGAGAQQGREAVCVRYLSTVGSSAVQRVDWFPTPQDAHSLRRAIDTYCPIPFLRAAEEDAREEGVRRLLLYQRDQNRRIRNPQKVIEDLRERLGGGWIVEMMMHDQDRHPCELVETLAGVDVLVTAHGFQSMLGLFMRPDTLLFEVFPIKYWKAGYAPMAEGLGVRHAFSTSRSLKPLMGYSHPSTETCMEWYLCRWYARSSDVELDEESMDRLVDLALPVGP